MASALAAHAAGLDTLVIEKTQYIGGSTARSGGGAWVPNAPALLRKGQRDDPAQVLRYLETIAGDRVPRERLARYVEEAPRMMEFLEGQSEWLRTGFFWIEGYSDYHPDRGGNPLGRGVWAVPIDRRALGEDQKHMRPGVKRMQLPLGAWITSVDLHDLLAVRWGGLRHKKILGVLAWRVIRARVTGERIVASGAALVTRLLLTLRQKGIPLWLETPMRSLVTDEEGRVVGAETEHEGRSYRIGARYGVILATGGFDHNLEMRRRYQPGIDEEQWSLGSPDNLGDGHRAGEAIGAALDLMDDAWWMPTMKMPDGTLFGLVAERQYPGQFIVNSAGERFVNESSPYTDFVHAQIAGHVTGIRHIPAWMIVDDRAWKRNFIAGHVPGTPLPSAWVRSGLARTGSSLEELAGKIGVPPGALRGTAERFNRFAREARDEDFHRGESAYDRYYGDPSYPNPNLAEVSRPPFYAFAITPGDLGTKGGMVTDEDARVLRGDGSVIDGLYATGNVSAAVMGNDYAGPGATIGPAMTFGYVAARHIAGNRDADQRAQATNGAEGSAAQAQATGP
jgi:succinate dehydrogenase/fumarate reductase flavoprotein subunit